jgi:hypothetical protein
MKHRLVILFFLLFIGMNRAMSQKIELKISLIEGTNIQVMSSVNLQWVRISAPENMQLIVEVENFNVLDGPVLIQAAYLNDGTSNISNAILFNGTRAVFPILNNSRLIHRINGLPQNVSVWIGVPIGQTRQLTIDYN